MTYFKPTRGQTGGGLGAGETPGNKACCHQETLLNPQTGSQWASFGIQM